MGGGGFNVLFPTTAVRGGEDPALQHPVRALRTDRFPSQVSVFQACCSHAVCGSNHPRARVEGLLQTAAGDVTWIQPFTRS